MGAAALSLSDSDLQGQGTEMSQGFISTARAAFPTQHFQEAPGTLWEYLILELDGISVAREGIGDQGLHLGDGFVPTKMKMLRLCRNRKS